MSQPKGRGRGRAGRGMQMKSKDFPSTSKSESKMQMKSKDFLLTSKSESEMAGESTSYSKNPPHTKSKIGEPGPGFLRDTKADKIEKLTSAFEESSISEKTRGCAPLGRGSYRGRRTINVTDVVSTKPLSCLNKQGKHGNPVDLVTNYFKVETMADWVLYQYRVDFNVDEERHTILRSWLRQHKEKLSNAYIFDGSMLFTSQMLTADKKPLTLTSIRENGEPVEITIRLIQDLKYGNSVYLQIFNILVRRCLMHLKLKLVNRNYFDPHASIRLPQHHLELWPGYITSIRQHESDVLMCSEISHKVMRNESALQVLAECIKESRDFRKLFQQTMIGCIILTDYNNKTYRVDDVDFNVNPESKFEYRNKEQITYVEYYEKKYQIKIRDLKQPLLISRSNVNDNWSGKEKQCLLVPELCRMTGLTSRMLENKNLMRDLADITRIGPETRIDRLKMFNKRLQQEKAIVEEFNNWGLKLSKELLSVKGRELNPESIIGGRLRKYPAAQNVEYEVDWTRTLRQTPMLLNAKFDSFVVICPSRLKKDTEEFLGCLNKAAGGMEFRIPRAMIMETRSDAPGELLDATEAAISKYSPDLILYSFTSERADRYSAIKRKCYVDRGVPSQVILARNLRSKGIMSIATKVAIQINSKIGGVPWIVEIPSQNVMVIGFDVCHDSLRKAKSVGAFVASLNSTMSAWYSSVAYHNSGEELSNFLGCEIVKAVKKFREINSNTLPSKIIFYRDGVGEGQFHHVIEYEVNTLKDQLTKIYNGENWKLAYIIVTKRINTRLFYRGRNPRPGTIVDDVITQPEKYDFFLVSQSVRQGTVFPTNYNVISDNLGWPADYIQRFTYKMTHLYYNCSTTIRVPAPCQYAHKLAFMVSQSLKTFPHPNLETKLYFL